VVVGRLVPVLASHVSAVSMVLAIFTFAKKKTANK